MLRRMAAVGLVLAVAGACSSGGGKPKEGSGNAGVAQVSTGAQTGGTTALGDPVATREGSSGKAKLRLDLYAVKRQGRVVLLNVAVTNTDPPGGDHFQVGQVFDDGVDNKGPNGETIEGLPNSDTVDGISLVDGKNAKRYLVARDSRGLCLCTGNASSIFVEAGQTTLLSAVFASPPPDVTSMSVQIPLFGVIDNVPVK
jgi:hypothetical protein